jgi:hypothetical protein
MIDIFKKPTDEVLQQIGQEESRTMLECVQYVIDNNAYDELNIPEPRRRVYEAMRAFSVNTTEAWEEERKEVDNG